MELENIKIYRQNLAAEHGADILAAEHAGEVLRFHQTIPEYSPTPLQALPELAVRLQVARICVKDESFRFGLKAFKGLGGSYSVARYIADELHIPPELLSFDRLTQPDAKELLGRTTLVTATDGNHGRGVAWAARLFGAKSVVYLPKGSSIERLEAIRSYGAQASITDLDYDDTVRYARDQAKRFGWVLMQDTSWQGYTKIPTYIMQGYLTMALEAVNQWQGEPPTHVFLQAGVGAMAGAVAGFLRAYYKEKKPMICIVEPQTADCIYQTAVASDGRLHRASGNLDTLMAGLACGEPCHIGWEILRETAEYFAVIPDAAAVEGMRRLAHPVGTDPAIVSGESGAATMGFLCGAARRDHLRDLLCMTCESRILLFSTEGDTSPELYQQLLNTLDNNSQYSV